MHCMCVCELTSSENMRYLVLGGGIAGVCCVEELCKLCPQDHVHLLSSDKTLKVISGQDTHLSPPYTLHKMETQFQKPVPTLYLTGVGLAGRR